MGGERRRDGSRGGSIVGYDSADDACNEFSGGSKRSPMVGMDAPELDDGMAVGMFLHLASGGLMGPEEGAGSV